MSINQIRAKQVAEQSQAIGQRREAESIVRIGDRIPLTGRHEVLDADGGIFQSGVKVYNAQEQYGDRVLPFPRTDGTIALDSEKGSVIRPPTAFPHCPGYLNGQVFNCEVPKKKKPGKIWVLYEYEGRIYVGGHQATPELIYDPIPPNSPTFIRNSSASMALFSVQIRENVDTARDYGQIWGDRDGWEASHGIRYPIPTLNFVTSSGAMKRNAGSSYRGNSLGKGVFLGDYASTTFGGTSNGSRTWKNSIADFESSAEGSGSHVYSRTTVREGISSALSSVISWTYPSPYNQKTWNYAVNEFRSILGSEPNRISEVSTDSFTLLFRDRGYAMFYRLNSSRVTGQYLPETATTFLVSDGRRDTPLFTAANLQQSQYNSSGYYSLFGNFGQSYSPKSYKFNNPSVTQVQSRSEFPEHQNLERDYDVKIFDIFKKESLVDGLHTIAKVSAWGIPRDAFIIDAAAWVP